MSMIFSGLWLLWIDVNGKNGVIFVLVNQRGGFVNYANTKLHTETGNPDVEIFKFEQKILGANVNFDNGIANLDWCKR